jgi:hypothetical protein
MALGLVGVLFAACSSDKTAQTPSRLSKRGESCQSSNDCDSSLVCVQGKCSVGSYGLMPTGKQCVLVQCHEPADCCPRPPATCAQLLQLCEGGLTFDCQQYMTACVCDSSKFSCDDGKCNSTQACTASDGVNFDSCQAVGAGICVGSKCVQCAKDTDCPAVGTASRVCKDNKCQIKCVKDLDCDPFYRCDMATSACVYKGCEKNLECIAKSNNPLAVCNAGQCDVPCQSDPECGNTVTSNQGGIVTVTPGLQVCVSSHCVEVGCDSDDQCRLMNVRPVGGQMMIAECRPVVNP